MIAFKIDQLPDVVREEVERAGPKAVQTVEDAINLHRNAKDILRRVHDLGVSREHIDFLEEIYLLT